MNTSSPMLLIIAILVAACGSPQKEEQTMQQQLIPLAENYVVTAPLKRSVFMQDIVSNGKLTAPNKADLQFYSNEAVTDIHVKNGDRVVKGQVLAELDKFRLSNSLRQAQMQMEQTWLELQNTLIGYGYSMSDSAKIPPIRMKSARIRSGYDKAEIDLQLAEHNYKAATLVAPFDGVVANLFTPLYNTAPTSAPFCTILDNKELVADFTVLESEMPLLSTGDLVVVTAYAIGNLEAKGHVTEINPTVDKTGLVRVRALVTNNARLYDGMNIKVKVRKELKSTLVIPKTALVLRDNKQVVFTYKDGKAQWNYVHTELENSDSFTLKDDPGNTLVEGDLLIIDGNLNLAHESPVVINHTDQ